MLSALQLRPRPMRLQRLLLSLVTLLMMAHAVQAQLRVVSYNTAGAARSGIDTILRAIGEEERNGIARPIDVLLLQEQTSFATTTQDILNLLNSPSMYGAGAYSMSMVNGGTTGAGRPGLIYKTSTVAVNDANTIALGTADVNGQPRQTMRYQLQPIGYDSSYQIYAYNSHYKADDDSTSQERRLLEASIIRADADGLGNGKHLIFAGDHNTYSSSEAGYQALLAPGAGQVHDPIGRPGNWSNGAGFADIHTQAPCLGPTGCGGLTSGGMDDRFDFQLISGELQDGVGLDYLQNSYRAFGNGGNVFNLDINAGCSTMSGCINEYAFNGVTSHTKKDVLDALQLVSDHLPVVADYTFTGSAPPPEPAILAKWDFEIGSGIPPTTNNTKEVTGITAAIGTGIASGKHDNAGTDWSSPIGNGSSKSFSVNTWTPADFFQFQTSTTGFEDILLRFDATGSSTGPRDFRIDFSTNGIDFTTTGETYVVAANATPPGVWTGSTYLSQYSYEFDLSHIAALNDQVQIFLRLVSLSTVSISGGTVGTSGSSRVDNVSILGLAITGLPGDHNGDGVVDILDYVVWRADPDGNGGAGGYDDWREAYGTGGGSGNANAGGAAVPEPCAAMLAVVGVCLIGSRRIRLRA